MKIIPTPSNGPENLSLKSSMDSRGMVHRFKLLFAPRHLNLVLDEAPTILLPPNQKPVNVLSHFLNYMRTCVETDIRRTFDNGEEIWDEYAPDAEYILT